MTTKLHMTVPEPENNNQDFGERIYQQLIRDYYKDHNRVPSEHQLKMMSRCSKQAAIIWIMKPV